MFVDNQDRIIDNEHRKIRGRRRNEQLDPVYKSRMPQNTCVGAINQEEARVDKYHHGKTRRDIDAAVIIDTQTRNNKLGDDACDKDNENINRKYNPPWEISDFTEPLCQNRLLDDVKNRIEHTKLLNPQK